MEILRHPQRITQELRRMNRYGILAAYLPEFGRIVGQMQHDLFHVYTVDEHTLFVLRNLRRFSVLEYAHEFPMCSVIFQRIPKPELLYIAALYHDIAKGRGGDHSQLGALDAEQFCHRHNLSNYDTNLVAWLIRHHLLMSTTAQRKDLSDSEVINEFANTVSNQSYLHYLYLLTVADMRATSPNVWNSWKDALLIELYNATTRALRCGLENPLQQSERIMHLQGLALGLLASHRIPKQQALQLWENLSEDYFIRHSADEIAWHTQAILQAKPQDLPLVIVRQRTQRGGTEIFIYADDQDFLFAHCTAAMEQLDLSVADARIITSKDDHTLDTFIVLEASGEPITDSYRIQEISTYLQNRLHKPESKLEPVSRHMSRRLKHFPIPTEITFRDDPINARTVMEVITSDRPGLLARIGLALTDCHMRLQNAKITTLGERVEDIFFITDLHNQPLSQPQQYESLRSTITRYLEQ
jgi:[protein-PII] uridylyltransferase